MIHEMISIIQGAVKICSRWGLLEVTTANEKQVSFSSDFGD